MIIMKKNNFEVLSREFFSAIGIVPHMYRYDISSYEFERFILERMQIGKKYCTFLDNTGFGYFDNKKTAEVGKGSLDSVVKHLKPTIITPFKDNFYLEDNDKVIVSNFTVYAEEPYLIDLDNQLLIRECPFDIYMTHNPYYPDNIKYWEDLHNSKRYGIIVGFYGKNYDKDKKNKLELATEFASRLDSDAMQSYDTDGECYFFAVGTKPSEIKKILSRSYSTGA